MFIHRLIWETYLQTKGAPLTWRHISTSWTTVRRELLLWQISWPLRKTDWTGCTRSTTNRQCVAFRWRAKLFRLVWERRRNDGHFLSQAQQQPRLDQKRPLDCLNNRSSSRKLICPCCQHNLGIPGQAQQSLSPPTNPLSTERENVLPWEAPWGRAGNWYRKSKGRRFVI